jgi:hypothetical protein
MILTISLVLLVGIPVHVLVLGLCRAAARGDRIAAPLPARAPAPAPAQADPGWVFGFTVPELAKPAVEPVPAAPRRAPSGR